MKFVRPCIPNYYVIKVLMQLLPVIFYLFITISTFDVFTTFEHITS